MWDEITYPFPNSCTFEVGEWISNSISRLYQVCEYLSINHISTWWHHQMETFSALLAFYDGNSLVTGEFTSQRPVTWRFDVFFDLFLNKRLNKPSKHWWFEMPLHSLWRHHNERGPEWVLVSHTSTDLGHGKVIINHIWKSQTSITYLCFYWIHIYTFPFMLM